MKVTYYGPYPSIDVPAAGITVEQGATVEVPDAVAVGLLEQPDNWSAVDPPKKTAAKRDSDTPTA